MLFVRIDRVEILLKCTQFSRSSQEKIKNLQYFDRTIRQNLSSFSAILVVRYPANIGLYRLQGHRDCCQRPGRIDWVVAQIAPDPRK